MLTAKLPFNAACMRELVRKITQAELVYPEKFPVGAFQLLQKIFVPDPKARATVAQIRDDPWFKVRYQQINGSRDDTPLTETDVVVSKAPQEPKLDAFALMAKIGKMSLEKMGEGPGRVATATSFTVKNQADVVLVEIQDQLLAMGAKVTKSKDKPTLKAKLMSDGSPLDIRVEVVGISRKSTLIEVIRVKGDHLRFLDQYRLLKENVA
jgi:5'-AMP-activated protein kinase catalytic alpha subunit